jgi:hypothetical protein
MYRRRHVRREIAFSFDSFLDMVANVVGVIIRLILVVWVGARTYTGMVALPPDDPPVVETSTEEPAEDMIAMPVEPLLDAELLPHQEELARLQKQLLDQMRDLQQVREQVGAVDKELADLSARNIELEHELTELERAAAQKRQVVRTVALSAEDLQNRYRKLADEIGQLKKLPSAKKTLQYRSPVSETIHAEELQFECCHGRVTFIETMALRGEMEREWERRKDEFRTSAPADVDVDPVGAFRAVFQVEREGPKIFSTDGHYEPVQAVRGETLEEAMRARSDFRQIVDAIDPERTNITFWVYDDSFAMFRQLRDYLYDRKVTVAGRPLERGQLIGWGRHGTASQGQ